METLLQAAIALLTGLSIVIPVIRQLIKFVVKATQERNWQQLLDLVIDLMTVAEDMFDKGAERKEWVLDMIVESAEYLNYPVDVELLSDKIDQLCDMTKVVNAPTKEQ